MKPQEALEMGKAFDLYNPEARAVWRSWTEEEKTEYSCGVIEVIRLLGYVQLEEDAARAAFAKRGLQ